MWQTLPESAVCPIVLLFGRRSDNMVTKHVEVSEDAVHRQGCGCARCDATPNANYPDIAEDSGGSTDSAL